MIPTFLVHTASVETLTGSGPTGRVFAAPVTVRGLLDDGLVRQQSASGEELVQKSVFYADIADEAKFAVDSRITVNGRKSSVVAVRRREAGPLFAGLAHVEVDLS
jgi:hypothetical protein